MLTSSTSAGICLAVLLFVSVLNRCATVTADDQDTREYIVDNILPEHPFLAAKLLSVLSQSKLPLNSYLQPRLHNEDEASQLELNDVIDAFQPSEKRGLGQCIHNCINGRGNMNFIQCKSMCH
ncbi:hypothetical protein BsWGS_08434 [Bradybaena similaris]